MTQPLPQVIVIAEPDIYAALEASGAGWDLQHRVATVGQMWDDLAGGRLSQTSSVLVFSDTLAVSGDLEAAIAAMAPHAAVFVAIFNPGDVEGLLARVRAAAEHQSVNPDAPVFVLPTTSATDLLDGLREALAGAIEFPAHWPAALTGTSEHPEYPVEYPEYPEAPVAPVASTPAPLAAPAGITPPPAPGSHPQARSVDQAQTPARSSQRAIATIASTSSKGGSGKSTTAVMLGAGIAQFSAAAGNPLKVVVVDMDTRDGQIASMIGSYVPTALNIRVSPTWDEETVLANLVHDKRLGIDALLAPIRPRTADDVGPDFYRHVIRILQQTHDVVIMDTSVNYLDPLISTVCLPEASAVLFVTTLATTSVQGMARALREITEVQDNGGMGVSRHKIGIVVNQSVAQVGMGRDQVLAAALGVPLVGVVPLATRDVLTATNKNALHKLLTHPDLGVAYYALARACLPGVPLTPLLAPPAGAVAPPAATSDGLATATAAPGPPTPEPARKRGLFNRGK